MALSSSSSQSKATESNNFEPQRLFDLNTCDVQHSNNWILPLRNTEDDKTPTAETGAANLFKKGTTPTNFDHDVNTASPFGRIMTPRLRMAGSSNTSTPRTEHTGQLVDSSSNNTSSFYSNDTSGTSGISSGLDEMMDVGGGSRSMRGIENAYRSFFHSTTSSNAPNMGLTSTFKSLDESIAETDHHQQQQMASLRNKSSPPETHSLLDNSSYQQPNKPNVNFSSPMGTSSGLTSLAVGEGRFTSRSAEAIPQQQQQQQERNILQELLAASNIQKQREQLEFLQMLNEENNLLRMDSLLSALRQPTVTSTEDHLRLLLQNHEILQILSSPLINSINQPTSPFGGGNSTVKNLIDAQAPPTFAMKPNMNHVSPTTLLNSLGSDMMGNILPGTINPRLSLNEVLNAEMKSPHAVAAATASAESANLLLGGSPNTPSRSQYDPDRINSETNNLAMAYRLLFGPVEQEIEKAAHSYRNSASCVAQQSDVAYHWSGKMPQRNYSNVSFSRKVFLGGVPWDITSEDLVSTFRNFGEVNVVWPNREQRDAVLSSMQRSFQGPKGYCYIVFNDELSVKMLLDNCTPDRNFNGAYFRMASPKFKTKDVQVIPWVVSDSIHIGLPGAKPDSKKTVFVGALHGMITAEALFIIMNDLFGNVVMSALDTDKYKYPIGSGRVVFATKQSYVRAVTANFVDVRTAKFNKTIQIDPYLEDSMCNNCFYQPGIYFCRSFECFRYFCTGCWQVWHNNIEIVNHKPLRRSFKTNNPNDRS